MRTPRSAASAVGQRRPCQRRPWVSQKAAIPRMRNTARKGSTDRREDIRARPEPSEAKVASQMMGWRSRRQATAPCRQVAARRRPAARGGVRMPNRAVDSTISG